MNKHIKYDLENAAIQMKVGIMNALYAISSGKCDGISLGKYISGTMLQQCLNEAEWQVKGDSFTELLSGNCIFRMTYATQDGKKLVEIRGSLFSDCNWELKVVK